MHVSTLLIEKGVHIDILTQVRTFIYTDYVPLETSDYFVTIMNRICSLLVWRDTSAFCRKGSCAGCGRSFSRNGSQR